MENPLEFLPPAELAQPYIKILSEIGFAMPNPMGGFLPISLTDISSFCTLYGVELTPNEVSMLRSASGSYVSAHWQSKGKTTIPPFVSDTLESMIRKQHSDRMKNLFKSFQKDDGKQNGGLANGKSKGLK